MTPQLHAQLRLELLQLKLRLRTLLRHPLAMHYLQTLSPFGLHYPDVLRQDLAAIHTLQQQLAARPRGRPRPRSRSSRSLSTTRRKRPSPR